MRPSSSIVEGHSPSRRYPLRPTVFFVGLAIALLAAAPLAAQEEEADVPVLPDDHPLRPQEPPRTDTSGFEKMTAAIGWLVRRPFEFLGTGAEGTAIWYEQKVGGLAAGLGGAEGAPREPSYVSPMVGSLGTRSGVVGLGVHVHSNSLDETGPQVGITAAATNRSYQEYTAYAGFNTPAEHPYFLVTGFYDVDAMDEFFGFGPDADEDDESSFSWERWGATAIAGLPERSGWLRANVHGGWEKSFVWEGDASDQPDAIVLFPEIDLPQIEIGSAGGALGLDFRDAPGHPTRGFATSGFATWYQSTDDFDFEWIHYGGEAQVHLPLGSEWHIISLGARAEEVDPQNDEGVPFVYLPALGGSETLRGYSSWRWRDMAAVTGTAEFRWKIWLEHTPDPDTAGTVEATLFYDVGQVGPSLDDIEFDDLKNSYGITVGMYLFENHLVTTGLGFSEEGPRFLFSTRGPW